VCQKCKKIVYVCQSYSKPKWDVFETRCSVAKMCVSVEFFGRPFGKRFALCYQTVVCLACPVCLSVTDVGVLWPNGWTDQDETWHAGRPHCTRWGPSSPSPKRPQPPSPIFDTYLLRPNGCMDQDVTWYEARPRSRRLYVRWGPRCPSPKRGRSPTNFRPMFIVAKRLNGSRWYSAWG